MKKISIALILVLSTSILPSINSTQAFATENTKNSHISTETNNISEVDFNYIQNHYLEQAPNGTFQLSEAISQKFSQDDIESVKLAMSGINSLIEKGVLKFELQKSKTDNSVQVINTVNNFNEYQKEMESQLVNSKVANFGKVLGSYTYCSSYNFSWWGYTTQVNVKGSTLLRDELKSISNMVGGVTGAVSLTYAMVKIFGPVWGPALAAAAGITGTITVGTALKNFSFGITSGNGTQVTGISDPYRGLFYKVEAK